jgi:adenosine deaminase
MNPSLLELCYKIPKAELHLHIEGTFEPELMFKIAKRNNITLPYKSVEELKEKYKFKNLQEFLDIYYQGCNSLIHEEDFSDLAFDYLEHACPQGLKYAEIFFDPQSHLSRGISFKTIITGLKHGLDKGKEKYGFDYKLIMCFLRHLPEEDAIKTLQEAIPFKNDILAVGLDSSEVGFPPENFKNVYEMARKEGFQLVAHAGEEGPAEYIRNALDCLKIKRIDHGVRIIEDEQLVKRAAEEQIPLTMCPLSNQRLQVCPDLKNYKLKDMMDKGLLCTINSDDPSYFGGYIGDNYKAVVENLGLTKENVIQLAKNSFIATFLSEEEKKKYIEDINKY